jgi:DMSO/TMAO reductase YedYZ heme-binding membrane subunit
VILPAATLGPSAYWYLARATGAVALVLLTASVVLGVMDAARYSSGPRWPRFAIDALHRDTSLLVIVLVVAHIVTSVLDGFAPISLLDGVVPFRTPYRPLWMALGALSFDLLIALVITSLLRRRLGYRSWRAIHWLAYASWPVAVLHGLGAGSDVKQAWMLGLTVVCVAAVVIAVLMRTAQTATASPTFRAGAMLLSIATPIGIGLFTFLGPLEKGWARRAGTPLRLLGAPHPSAASALSTASAATSQKAPSTHAKGPLDRAFTATLSGTVSQSAASGGAIIELSLQLGGSVSGQMRIRLGGSPLPQGGLSLTGSQVDLTGPGMPSAMGGKVVSLQGDRFLARVSDVSGSVVDLQANLSIDQNTGAVTGTLTGHPIGGGP